MLFHKPEYNIVAEEHKEPIGNLFIVGILEGIIISAHVFFVLIPGMFFDMQLVQAAFSIVIYCGITTIGLFRTFEYIKKQKRENNRQVLYYIGRNSVLACLCGAGIGLLGATPFGFVNYVGSGIYGEFRNLSDFIATIFSGAVLAGCVSFLLGFIYSIVRVFNMHKRPVVLMCIAVISSIGGCHAAYFLIAWFPHVLWYYGLLFGLFLGGMMVRIKD